MRKIKRILAIILVITLVSQMLPTSVIATETETGDEQEIVAAEQEVAVEEVVSEKTSTANIENNDKNNDKRSNCSIPCQRKFNL